MAHKLKLNKEINNSICPHKSVESYFINMNNIKDLYTLNIVEM